MDLAITKEKLHEALAILKQGAMRTAPSVGCAFRLIFGWFFSLFVPVSLLGLGIWMGTLTDKMHGMKDGGPYTMLGTLIPGCLIAAFYAGWIKMCLDAADQKTVAIRTLLQPILTGLNAAGVLLITVIATNCGGLALIPFIGIIFALPGAFLHVKLQFAPYYVVDQGLNPISALAESWKATNKVFIQLAIVDLAILGIAIVSAPLVIGPFLMFIVQSVTYAVAYRLLAVPVDDDDD